MRAWHQLELVGDGLEHLPPTGPVLVLVNHVSALDVVALLSIDPWPRSAVIVKEGLYNVKLIRPLLRAWNAIPVARNQRDIVAVRALHKALRDGYAVAIAAEGTRSRTGRLLPINPVLARMVTRMDVLFVPVGISGTFEALPPGKLFPRRRKVIIRVGIPFRLAPGTSADEAAARIGAEIAMLLPAEQRPLATAQEHAPS
jgi:1-acyl-sn-glycerol-3-phosphate acyltransferase